MSPIRTRLGRALVLSVGLLLTAALLPVAPATGTVRADAPGAAVGANKAYLAVYEPDHVRRPGEDARVRFGVWDAVGAYRTTAVVRMWDAHDHPFLRCVRDTTPDRVFRVHVSGNDTYQTRSFPLGGQGDHYFTVSARKAGRNAAVTASSPCAVFEVQGTSPTVSWETTGPADPEPGDRVGAVVTVRGMNDQYRKQARVTLSSWGRKGCYPPWNATEKVFKPIATGPTWTYRTPRYRVPKHGPGVEFGWSLTLPGTASQNPVRTACTGPTFARTAPSRPTSPADRSGTGTTDDRLGEPLLYAPGGGATINRPSGVRFGIWDYRGDHRRTATVTLYRRPLYGRQPICTPDRRVRSWKVPVRGSGTYETPDFGWGRPGEWSWSVTVPGDARNPRLSAPCAKYTMLYTERTDFEATPYTSRDRAAPGSTVSVFYEIDRARSGQARTGVVTAWGPVPGRYSPSGCETYERLARRTVKVSPEGSYPTVGSGPVTVPDGPGYVAFTLRIEGTPQIRPTTSSCGDDGSFVRIKAG